MWARGNGGDGAGVLRIGQAVELGQRLSQVGGEVAPAVFEDMIVSSGSVSTTGSVDISAVSTWFFSTSHLINLRRMAIIPSLSSESYSELGVLQVVVNCGPEISGFSS